MAFLAQIRLDELAAAFGDSPLPHDGLLVVFAGLNFDAVPVADAVHAEVVATSPLRRVPWPKRLDPELRYEPADTSLEPIMTVNAHLEHPQALDEIYQELAEHSPIHQMFGHAAFIQPDDPPPNHTLLFQLDEDALLRTSFADGGRLYLWCPNPSLHAPTLHNCHLEIQSF
jgi:uncharacterized protein YwqG